jgi:predicted dehydrogenase
VSSPVGIACLGAARIAPKALIHPASVMSDALLVAIGARDTDRAHDFAQRYGFTRSYGAYDAAIDDPEVSLVYNALPAHLHAPWSIRAAEAGRHVLCEKPFAMNANEVRRMRDAARINGVRMIEAFHHRYHPMWIGVLGWIRSGAIGRIRTIDATFNCPIDQKGGAEIRYRPECGGGAFMDLGCYALCWTLDIMDAEPHAVEAEATLTESGVDLAMDARLVFPEGAVVNLATSMAPTRALGRSMRIIGEHGEIEFINPVSPHMGGVAILRRHGREERLPPDPLTTYFHQLRAVLGAIRDGAPLPTEGANALRQQETLDRVYAAAGLAHLRASQRT